MCSYVKINPHFLLLLYSIEEAVMGLLLLGIRRVYIPFL